MLLFHTVAATVGSASSKNYSFICSCYKPVDKVCHAISIYEISKLHFQFGGWYGSDSMDVILRFAHAHTHTLTFTCIKYMVKWYNFDGRRREWGRIKTASTTLTTCTSGIGLNSKRATTKPRKRYYYRCCYYCWCCFHCDAVIKSIQHVGNSQRLYLYQWQRYSNQSICRDQHHRHHQKR